MNYVAQLSRLARLLIVLVALSSSAALAQDAVVKRNVYLRPVPSTANTPIRKLLSLRDQLKKMMKARPK